MAGIHDILADDLARTAFASVGDDPAGIAEAVTHTAASDGAETATAGCWLSGPSVDRDAQDGAEHAVRRGEFLLQLAPAAGTIAPAVEDTLEIDSVTYVIYDIPEVNAAFARCRLYSAARTRLAGPNSRMGGRG